MAHAASLPILSAESGLSRYLDEIRKFPMLEPQQEYMLAKRWREHGDSKAALWSATNSLRLELAPQNTLVVGAHLGYTDTDMVADVDAPKNDPRDVAAAILDGVEQNEVEVLADDLTRAVRAGLSAPVPNPLRTAAV